MLQHWQACIFIIFKKNNVFQYNMLSYKMSKALLNTKTVLFFKWTVACEMYVNVQYIQIQGLSCDVLLVIELCIVVGVHRVAVLPID